MIGGLVAVILGLSVLAGCGGSSTTGPTSSEITITAVAGLRWDAPVYRTERGEITLVVKNDDSMVHNMVILTSGGQSVRNVDVRVEAGQTKSVTVPLDPGEYQIFCTIPGHQTMKSRLIVS